MPAAWPRLTLPAPATCRRFNVTKGYGFITPDSGAAVAGLGGTGVGGRTL